MNSGLKKLTQSIPAKHLIFIILFWCIIFDFALSASFRNPLLRLIFNDYLLSSFLLFLLFCFLIFIFVAVRLRQKAPNPAYSLIILSPIILLFLWPVKETNLSILIPFLVLFSTQIIFYKILFSDKAPPQEGSQRKKKITLLIIVILYFFIFSYIGIRIFKDLSFFNPKDFGLFNQTFWNTIHGKLFLNSTYGSHFACHNTLFFIFLVPFYYLFPYPISLLILKIMFLSLSAIPFYLITKDILNEASAIPLVLAFMFFPFIAGQNFTPPHEMGYAPFFILFTFYFFQKKKFMPFLCFLLIMVSIKETLALVALMFGCYAFLEKRRGVWIIWPIIIGIAWFFFSIILINYFQNLYLPDSDSAWYFVYLKKAFMENKNNPLMAVSYLLSNSNIARWYTVKSVFLLFFSLGIAPALLSPAALLGLPELIVNLLACNARIFSPIWHYNIALSCFVLIGTIEGIKKISSFVCKKNYFRISEQKIQLLLCVSVLSCGLIQCYTWIEPVEYKKDVSYIKKVKEALSFVPPNASITVPTRIAIIVSGREKYSIIGSDSGEDYILIDSRGMQKI